mmetsp:Transcript_137203/g.242588  ORF Transcript_137203/g.242588 Transcript_137203/m.242588 type:complete len:417 (-) Transcript_137203:80-1330(-)
MNPVIARPLGAPDFGLLLKTDGGYKLQLPELSADTAAQGPGTLSISCSLGNGVAAAAGGAGAKSSPSGDGSLPRRPTAESYGSGLQDIGHQISAALGRREATPPGYRRSPPREECRVAQQGASPRHEPPWPSTATTSASSSSPAPAGAVDSTTSTSPPGADGAESEATLERLRGKLLEMGSSFVGFDKVVEKDTVRRRQAEHQRVQEVLDGLARLEKRFNVEIKRRLEANTSSQEVMEKLLSDMLSRVQGRILHRFELLSQSMESLFGRLVTLERGIQQFKGELPSNLQVETASLFQAIREITNNFEDDRRQRSETDQFLFRRLEESDCNVDARVEQELAALERCAEAVQMELEEFSADADTPIPSKWVGLLENLAQLRGGIAKEAQRRETVDDQVVQAINQYTSALQRTLSMSNT